MRVYCFGILFLSMSLCWLGGCARTQGNVGNMAIYQVPVEEESWIRNGEPIEFEGEYWFPEDGFSILLDSEVLLLGNYKDVQFFVEKIDVRPYNRLYTKFGRNKYRIFKKRTYD